MVDPSLAADWGQALVGLAILFGAAKSAYNGTLRNSYEWLQMIEKINERGVYMEERQEEIIDALVALSHVQDDEDAEIDPHEVRYSFDRVDRSRSFIDRGTREDRRETRHRREASESSTDVDTSPDGGREVNSDLIYNSGGGGSNDTSGSEEG